MVMIKYDINQQHLKTVDLHFANLINLHSFEVVDRVSETQFQVDQNSVNNLAVKGIIMVPRTSNNNSCDLGVC